MTGKRTADENQVTTEVCLHFNTIKEGNKIFCVDCNENVTDYFSEKEHQEIKLAKKQFKQGKYHTQKEIEEWQLKEKHDIRDLIPKQKVLELIEKLEEKGFHRKDKDKRLISYWFTYNEIFRFKKEIKEI